ncbi:hypothetical protein ASPCAL14832 [Aspergillus calidoustus]|uniref:Uncharacterized protein n=1 Tax=Aspergillus calidoustus TaxID=454130 RepID=A0A0U5GJZ4_ASPCI|nr:hypothetical protein ASPCAL14832 [Aspergillus calidoustus]
MCDHSRSNFIDNRSNYEKGVVARLHLHEQKITCIAPWLLPGYCFENTLVTSDQGRPSSFLALPEGPPLLWTMAYPSSSFFQLPCPHPDYVRACDSSGRPATPRLCQNLLHQHIMTILSLRQYIWGYLSVLMLRTAEAEWERIQKLKISHYKEFGASSFEMKGKEKGVNILFGISAR